jgi:hypothetical protein
MVKAFVGNSNATAGGFQEPTYTRISTYEQYKSGKLNPRDILYRYADNGGAGAGITSLTINFGSEDVLITGVWVDLTSQGATANSEGNNCYVQLYEVGITASVTQFGINLNSPQYFALNKVLNAPNGQLYVFGNCSVANYLKVAVEYIVLRD